MLASSLQSFLRTVQTRRGLREVGFVIALYLVYLLTRIRSTRAVDEALNNARDLVEWERSSGWLVEQAAQQFVIGPAAVAVIFNLLYALPHFLAVLGFLWWVYRHRPTAYPFARNVFYLSTLTSFVIFVIYPVAPPSAVPELGIIDTMAMYGPVSYNMGADPFRNAFAAMPSVHIVYAMIAGVGFASLARSWWLRIFASLYVPFSIMVIVVTGNHFIADAAGAAVPLAIAAPAAWLIQRSLARSRPLLVE
jgi:hypothetical protein